MPGASGANPIDFWSQLWQLYGPDARALWGRLLIALLIALLANWAATLARRWSLRVLGRTPADINVRMLLGRLVQLSLLAIGLIWALYVLGVDPTALLAAIGVVGLAISLALQDILKNYFSGIYLLFERPFRIGDEISLRDWRGTIEDIGMRTTRLRTADDLQVVIPNAIVLSEIVVNRSVYVTSRAESTEEEPAGAD